MRVLLISLKHPKGPSRPSPWGSSTSLARSRPTRAASSHGAGQGAAPSTRRGRG